MLPLTQGFIELLVVGVEASVWILFLALSFAGPGIWRGGVPSEWQNTALFVYTALAYGLGVVVDRLADSAYWRLRDPPCVQSLPRLHRILYGERKAVASPEEVRTMRTALQRRDDSALKFLEYQRSRLRIARATSFNVALAIPVGGWFVLFTARLGFVRFSLFMLFALLALWGTVRATEKLREAYEGHLRKTYELSGEVAKVPKHQDEIPGCRRAAAVCYRVEGGRIQFLLVGTSDGKRWTFPKGHVESKEEPWQAAAREAKEEAGAVGPIARESFTTYLFPAKKEGGCPCLTVLAYLLRVDDHSKAEEYRPWKWLPPEEAVEALAQRRRGAYAREHHRVLDEARALLEAGGPSDEVPV